MNAWWPGERFVIRYNHRDTDQSVSYEPGSPPYVFRDLVDDAVDLLDHFPRLAGAHVVGMSMGRAIKELMALDHPDRVDSLTLISTGSPPAGARGPGSPRDVPSRAATGSWRSRPTGPTAKRALNFFLVHLARVSAAHSQPFNEEPFRALAGRVFDRTVNMESAMTNHALLAGDGRWRDRLADLERPDAGHQRHTEDPVVPYGNGVALANDIPTARLVALEQTGHELPRRVWDVVVPPAILEHTSGD